MFSSLLQNVHTGSGPHPATYFTGTRVPSLRAMQPGREAHHSPPSSAKVKNEWSYTTTPQHMPSWHAQGKISFITMNTY
jgi:hypothetical protein